jgi:FAD/FMN-containing dehydrogenase
MELVLPDGENGPVGTEQGDSTGYDFCALFERSEGTLALVTEKVR